MKYSVDEVLHYIDEHPEEFASIRSVRHTELLDELGISDHAIMVSSATMALYGIRENCDLDIIVDIEHFDNLINVGLVEEESKFGRRCVKYGKLDMFTELMPGNVPSSKIDFIEVDGYKFHRLRDVILWKRSMGRDKDVHDLKLISEFVDKVIRNLEDKANE